MARLEVTDADVLVGKLLVIVGTEVLGVFALLGTKILISPNPRIIRISAASREQSIRSRNTHLPDLNQFDTFERYKSKRLIRIQTRHTDKRETISNKLLSSSGKSIHRRIRRV